MNARYCRPEKDSNEYFGWHLKALRCYDTEEEAERVASTYGSDVFYCEYGNCYHISARRRNYYGKA